MLKHNHFNLWLSTLKLHGQTSTLSFLKRVLCLLYLCTVKYSGGEYEFSHIPHQKILLGLSSPGTNISQVIKISEFNPCILGKNSVNIIDNEIRK